MKFLLLLLSLFSRIGSGIKNALYSYKILVPQRAPLPVISIGNISFGGTEKTPLALHVLSFLTKNHFKPALVSRGYKGTWEKKGGVLANGKKIRGDWKASGDEPFMIAQNLDKAGVFIGKNRFASCKTAKAMGFDAAVMDDGFQHRRLFRDLDIVLFNPEEKIALRESTSALKRSDIILIKKVLPSEAKEKTKKSFLQAEIYEYSVITKGVYKADNGEQVPIGNLKRKKILAFCGIAYPERFLSQLSGSGITPEISLTFPDHHPYPLSSLERIKKNAKRTGIRTLITTEKDAVKVKDRLKSPDLSVFFLKIELQIDDAFYSSIINMLPARTG